MLGEAPPPLLNPLASPKSFPLGNDQIHLTLLSLNQDFPLLGGEDLTSKPAVWYSQTSSRPFGVARDYLRNRIAIVYAPRARLPQGFYRPQIITD